MRKVIKERVREVMKDGIRGRVRKVMKVGVRGRVREDGIIGGWRTKYLNYHTGGVSFIIS